MLPATAQLDRLAPPDSGRAVEVEKISGAIARRLLDHYRDLDSVADAWFLRGLKAMVAPKPADFLQQPEWRRIEICLLAWFDALAPAGERP